MNATLTSTNPHPSSRGWLVGAYGWALRWFRGERPLNHVWIALDLPEELADDAVRCAVVSALLRSPAALQVPPPELQRAVPGSGAAWRLGVWTRETEGDAGLEQLRYNLAAELSRRGLTSPRSAQETP